MTTTTFALWAAPNQATIGSDLIDAAMATPPQIASLNTTLLAVPIPAEKTYADTFPGGYYAFVGTVAVTANDYATTLSMRT